MQFARFPRKTILAATLLLAFGTANASVPEQAGTPQTTPSIMKTYGVEVPTRVGLKAVIPAGWQLFVHQSAELPETLSWKVDESWVSALSNFADDAHIALMVDWDKKAVYFRSKSVAMREQEQRKMIAQAAATPLPTFKASEPKAVTVAPAAPVAPVADKAPVLTMGKPVVVALAEKPVAAALVATVMAPVAATVTASANIPVTTPAQLAAISVAAVQASDPLDVFVNPTVAVIVAAPAVVVAPVALVSAQAPATGMSRPPKAAPVVMAKTDSVSPRAAAVTPAISPAIAQVASAAAPRATVLDADILAKARAALAADHPSAASLVATPAAVVVAPVAVAPVKAVAVPVVVQVVKVVVPAPAAAPVVTAPAKAVVVQVATVSVAPFSKAAEAPAAYVEQSLETPKTLGEAFNQKTVDEVIRAAAEKNGYTVSWEAADARFQGPVTILGADMAEDMKLVLRALGGRRSPVAIDVYRSSGVVRVRNASGAAEVVVMDVPFQGGIREKSASSFTAKALPAATYMRPDIVVATLAAPAAMKTVTLAPAVAPVATVAPAAANLKMVPEPVRLDTASANVKKLAPASVGTSRSPAQSPFAADRDLPSPVVGTTPPVTLRVAQGGALRDALEGLLEKGWTLKWEVSGDMEANTALEVAGDSLAAVLNKVLPRLSLSADIYSPSKLVVIRPADAALDK